MRRLRLILEIAPLYIKTGQNESFEESFREASSIISQMPGYIHHELLKCLENESKYVLMVRWEKLEDHTQGFRNSKEYSRWKKLLHHYYDPFPVVEHYKELNP